MTACAIPRPDPIRSFSFGGGWQSMASMVLAAQGVIDFRLFLFANVGDDSENPETIEYVHKHAVPYAAEHGLELVELQRVSKDGQPETIYRRIMDSGGRRQTIPVYLSNGMPGGRACTHDFKIWVTGQELQQRGASPKNKATVGMGISLDEIGRMKPSSAKPYEELVYPLIDLRLRRTDCPGIIRSAGLPMPPKSACDFCPIRKIAEWQDMHETQPARWDRACRVEDTLNAENARKGRQPVYLTRVGRPLRDLFKGGSQLALDDEDEGCDNGWCMT